MAKNNQAQVTTENTENTNVVTETAAPAKPDISTIDVKGLNKSQAIRLYASKGYSRGETAKHLGIKYQFVRNVLVAEAGKAAQAK
jgi:predicted DNA-binding protein (UPF0251 family)